MQPNTYIHTYVRMHIDMYVHFVFVKIVLTRWPLLLGILFALFSIGASHA